MKKLYPKHVGDCHVKANDPKRGLVVTNCERGKFASGGAILDSLVTDPPRVLAIISADNESADMAKEVQDSGHINRRTFDINEWAAYETPIDNLFLKALDLASP